MEDPSERAALEKLLKSQQLREEQLRERVLATRAELESAEAEKQRRLDYLKTTLPSPDEIRKQTNNRELEEEPAGILEVFKLVSKKLPSGKDPDSVAKRQEMFKKMDINNDGVLDLGEVEEGVRINLGLGRYLNKTVIKKAFKLSASLQDYAGGKRPRRLSIRSMSVEPKEFRALCGLLRYFFELVEIFRSLSGGSEKLLMKDFCEGVPDLKRWNCKDIEKIEKNPVKYFKEVDKYGKGAFDLDMFLDWALYQRLDHDNDDDYDDHGVMEYVLNTLEGTGERTEGSVSTPARGGVRKSLAVGLTQARG